jgi:hypothetical protein
VGITARYFTSRLLPTARLEMTPIFINGLYEYLGTSDA